ncbi:hypothetical protein ACA910_010529 [Epithemia clementina (nom. ined.)]
MPVDDGDNKTKVQKGPLSVHDVGHNVGHHKVMEPYMADLNDTLEEQPEAADEEDGSAAEDPTEAETDALTGSDTSAWSGDDGDPVVAHVQELQDEF